MGICKTLCSIVLALSASLIIGTTPINAKPANPNRGYTLSEQYREPSDYSDKRIAKYLADVSKDGNEHIIFYIPEKDSITEVTQGSPDANNMMRVYLNEPMAARFLSENSHLIIAHSHPQDYDVFIRFIKNALKNDPKQRNMILDQFKKAGKRRINERRLNEIPSLTMTDSLYVGDIPMLLNETVFALSRNPDIKIENRIVVLRKKQDPQVIDYGLTQSALTKLRESTPIMKRKNIYEILEFHDLISGVLSSGNMMPDSTRQAGFALLKEYSGLIEPYTKSHCYLTQNDDCIPPRSSELADIINKSRHFFVKDRGTVKIK